MSPDLFDQVVAAIAVYAALIVFAVRPLGRPSTTARWTLWAFYDP